MINGTVFARAALIAAVLILTFVGHSTAQTAGESPAAQAPASAGAQSIVPVRIRCESKPGERESCSADTSSGVVLASSFGLAPCLLGRTWGYDATSIWVSDGCGAEFIAGQGQVAQQPTKLKPLEHVPNAGFLLYSGEEGEIYFRLFSYVRYLNQRNIDPSYTDSFGVPHSVQQRQDIQLAKFFAPFSGWFLSPKFRYYLYVWSSNASQGDPAQVVGAGNLSFTFNRFVSVGGGITSLPTVRSTEGQFPYWLGVDGRMIADEFFRGSYTNGVWVKGDIGQKLKYNVMFATNLSILGVSASQIDNKMDTQSYALQWLPTTGEFGLFGTFGDYDYHEKVATRAAVHWSHSLEDKQSQPSTSGIENSQIRLSDGSVVFTPDLFGKGITVNNVDYKMTSVDAGVKYKGLSLEGEYYWRWLTNFTGTNTGGIPDISDTGYQLQASAMAVKDILQVYLSGSQIFGAYGDSSEVRVGESWYFMKKRGLRLNTEFIHVNNSPVGYTAYPMPVGANGNIIHVNLEMNF
ncbi:MAG: DUF3011 domain-containing protein [Vicinamibacterales bacterium]|nr:DUF3011 domain-containing protein [Vicinamibacterales bacterium]